MSTQRRNKPFRFGWLILSLLLCCVAIWIAIEYTLTPPLALSQLAKQQPWFVRTGLRTALLQKYIPTVDRVVLVPDEATFLTALQQWSLNGRWPILIEDRDYTPKFIERFQPAETIRLPSVKQPLPKGKQLRELMQKTLALTWDAVDSSELRQTWVQLGWQPPGVVITSENDPAWPAALALASGRGQPLAFLPGNFGKPNDTLNSEQWQRLRFEVQKAVDSTGYFYTQLGDLIDTVTIARELAVKYQSLQKKDEQLAVTDGLGRDYDERRWAVVGWIYGSSNRTVYQAMCSLFLGFQTAMLYDSYPDEGNWKKYEVESASNQLRGMGLEVETVQKPEAILQTWQRLVSQDWTFDLTFVNSRGNPDAFFIGNGDARVTDIPKLRYPTAVHFLHSWSATRPDDPNTVAGKWLENGVYAYVGSVHEPYLSAFVPPKLIVERLSQSVPFLIAVRLLEARPWKVATFGDPLMIVSLPRQRVPPSQQPLPKATQ